MSSMTISEMGRALAKAGHDRMTPEARTKRARKAGLARWARMSDSERKAFMSRARRQRKEKLGY